MSLISGYGQSLFAPLSTTGADGKQQKLTATNWRFSDVREFSEKPVTATSNGGGAQGLVHAQTAFAAQSIAQETGEVQESSVGVKTAKETFLEYQSMSTAEKYRAMFLGQMGMTEEELEALPPEEREKIEAELREKIKEAVEEEIRKKEQEKQQ